MSPQHFLGKGYDEKCDIWSCGVLAYEMLSGAVPFLAPTEGETKKKIKNGHLKFPDDEWKEIGCKAKSIIKSMLTYDDTKRPRANELLQNEWIADFRTLSDIVVPDNLYDRMKRFHEAPKLKRIALSVIAQQIRDNSELDVLKEIFQVLDADRDGFITAEEMVSVFKKERASEGKDDFEEVIRSCSTAGNQKIDITEFLAATMEKQSYDRKTVLLLAFHTFDSDHDGTISKKDLAGLLRETDIDSPIVRATFAEAANGEDTKELGIDFEAFQRIVAAEERFRKFTLSHEG
jgi:calcium-dependent protein kinase